MKPIGMPTELLMFREVRADIPRRRAAQLPLIWNVGFIKNSTCRECFLIIKK